MRSSLPLPLLNIFVPPPPPPFSALLSLNFLSHMAELPRDQGCCSAAPRKPEQHLMSLHRNLYLPLSLDSTSSWELCCIPNRSPPPIDPAVVVCVILTGVTLFHLTIMSIYKTLASHRAEDEPKQLPRSRRLPRLPFVVLARSPSPWRRPWRPSWRMAHPISLKMPPPRARCAALHAGLASLSHWSRAPARCPLHTLAKLAASLCAQALVVPPSALAMHGHSARRQLATSLSMPAAQLLHHPPPRPHMHARNTSNQLAAPPSVLAAHALFVTIASSLPMERRTSWESAVAWVNGAERKKLSGMKANKSLTNGPMN